MSRVKVYINTPPWLVSRHRTDWESKEFMKEMGRRFPEIEMTYPEGWRAAVGPNAAYIQKQIRHRLKLGRPFSRPTVQDKLAPVWMDDLSRLHADVLLSHDQFPARTGGIPVLWESQYLDPREYLAEPTASDVDSWNHWQGVFGELASRSAVVGLRGTFSVNLARKAFPNLASRFRDLLFFLPHLESVPEDEVLRKHQAPSCLEVLFVGRQARLKGLPRVLEAVEQARKKIPIRLHVVSRFDDGKIQLPAGDWLEVHGELARSEIRKLFLRCQVQIMPSLKESYGWVYLEGLAAGCVVMARDREPQREIVDYGKAGVLIDPMSSADMALKLERLWEDDEWRTRLALAGLRRFQEQYHWSVVGRSWCDAFSRAAGINADTLKS